MSRKIPVYDTTQTSNITNHIIDWDDWFLNEENYHKYTKSICDQTNCKPVQHLEISKKSNHKIGKELRTASLIVNKGGNEFYSESLYQGSKVTKKNINSNWLYEKTGDFSLIEKSKTKHRKTIAVNFFGFVFPTSTLSDLHDLLYWLGIENTHPNIKETMAIFNHHEINFFTDCFDSPGKNSQSKSFATYYWRWKRKESVFDNLTKCQKEFLKIIENNSFEKSTRIVVKNFVVKPLF